MLSLLVVKARDAPAGKCKGDSAFLCRNDLLFYCKSENYEVSAPAAVFALSEMQASSLNCSLCLDLVFLPFCVICSQQTRQLLWYTLSNLVVGGNGRAQYSSVSLKLCSLWHVGLNVVACCSSILRGNKKTSDIRPQSEQFVRRCGSRIVSM